MASRDPVTTYYRKRRAPSTVVIIKEIIYIQTYFFSFFKYYTYYDLLYYITFASFFFFILLYSSQLYVCFIIKWCLIIMVLFGLINEVVWWGLFIRNPPSLSTGPRQITFLFNFERIPTWLGWILETLWSVTPVQAATSLFFSSLSLEEEEKYSNITISNLTLVCTHNFRACYVAGFFNDRPTLSYSWELFSFSLWKERRPHFFFSIKHEKFDFDPTQIKEVMQSFRNSVINKENNPSRKYSLGSKFDAVIQILTALYYLLVNSSQSRLMLHDWFLQTPN